jgi:hypothetical protein
MAAIGLRGRRSVKRSSVIAQAGQAIHRAVLCGPARRHPGKCRPQRVLAFLIDERAEGPVFVVEWIDHRVHSFRAGEDNSGRTSS